MKKFLPPQRAAHASEHFPKGFSGATGYEETKAYVAIFCAKKNHVPMTYSCFGKAFAA